VAGWTRAAALVLLWGTAFAAAAGTVSDVAAMLHGMLLLPSAPGGLLAGVVALRRRDRALGMAAGAVLVAAVAAFGLRVLPRVGPGPGGPDAIDVVTYNLLFRGGRPDATLAALRAEHADLYLLQEVTPAWGARLEAALRRSHPHAISRPHPGTHGLALYSRFPLDAPVYLENDSGRAVAQCTLVHAPGEPLVVCNVHLASPAGALQRPWTLLAGFEANAAMRRRQWRSLRDLLARAWPGARAVVVAGDLNSLEVEPVYDDLRRELVDAFAAAGEGPAATFPSGVPAPAAPVLRLDYVLASPALRPLDAHVGAEGGSDHRAVWARLALPAARPGVAISTAASAAAGEGDRRPRRAGTTSGGTRRRPAREPRARRRPRP
jgi:endonuclease/exonuclease/phosphatase (EEP) superfamily protein YafD